MSLNYAGGGFAETVTELADYERAGLDQVFVPEAYRSTPSARSAHRREDRASRIGSGIFNSTGGRRRCRDDGGGLDDVSQGRFMLGLGASARR